MRANRPNITLIMLFFLTILMFSLVVALQLRTLPGWNGLFNPGGNSFSAEVVTALPDDELPAATRIVPSLAMATDMPIEEAGVPLATIATPVPSTFSPAAAAAPGSANVAMSSEPSSAGDQVLGARRITTSSDDHVLVDMVANSPYAVGIVSHATYEEQRELVRSVALPATDGSGLVQPEPGIITEELYPLTYSVYLYTSKEILDTRPEVVAFLGCYLSRAYVDAELVGLFPLSIADYTVTVASYSQQTGLIPGCGAAGLADSTLPVLATSSLTPLTQRIGGAFRGAGYAGAIAIETHETRQSVQIFCQEVGNGLVAASRALYEDEIAACASAGHNLVSFEIAKDAATVVVSQENGFLTETGLSELQLLFAGGDLWSNVQAGWPNEPIVRAVPSEQSGGFAKFISTVFSPDVPSLPLQANTSGSTTADSVAGAAGTGAVTTDGVVTDVAGPTTGSDATSELVATAAVGTTANSADPFAGAVDQLVVAGVEGRVECSVLAGVIALVLEESYNRPVDLVVASDTDALYDRLAWEVADAVQQVDISPCYTDLADRAYLRDKGSSIAMMHNIYGRIGDDKLYLMAHSSVPPVLRSQDNCLYQFFRQVAVDNMESLRGQTPAEWLADNSDLVSEWTRCAP